MTICARMTANIQFRGVNLLSCHQSLHCVLVSKACKRDHERTQASLKIIKSDSWIVLLIWLAVQCEIAIKSTFWTFSLFVCIPKKKLRNIFSFLIFSDPTINSHKTFS